MAILSGWEIKNVYKMENGKSVRCVHFAFTNVIQQKGIDGILQVSTFISRHLYVQCKSRNKVFCKL